MSLGVTGSWRGTVSVPSSIPPAYQSHIAPSADLAVTIFVIITGVVSVLGNGTVLLVYCRKRKKLRPSELMTINLAICDFGYSLLGAPFITISSMSHAWVFGEAGCHWYGFQGFVFGIGSLITTCLISLDRCFKICSVRYGQWIERRHVSLSIGLAWAYTLFWASLPVLGFGSYGPEPYGTSCTINWWGMRSFLSDRIYIFLIMILCFAIPTLAIFASYMAILLRVYRSKSTLASIPSSTVTHSSKDLRLAKIAAVVCSTFLLAWTPYIIVSLYSTLAPKDEQGGEEGVMQPVVGGATGVPNISNILGGLPSLFNWTSSTENYGNDVYYDSGLYSSNSSSGPGVPAGTARSSPPAQEGAADTESYQPQSCLPPIMTLIPAMFAKSHCMINPFIYQIMNREFRKEVCAILFRRERWEKRRMQGGCGSYSNRGGDTLYYTHSWRRRSSHPMGLSMVELGKRQKDGGRNRGERGSWLNNISVVCDAVMLDMASLDTQVNIESQRWNEGKREGGSTSSSVLTK